MDKINQRNDNADFDEDLLKEKIKKSVRLIKSVASQHNFTIAFSGGKDSCVLEYLVKEAGVKCEKVYNNTTIDPPYTIKFCQKKGVKIMRPNYSFLDLVEKKGMPTMFKRFCCKELKQKYIADYLFTGVRQCESSKRTKCYTDFDSVYYYSKKIYTQCFHPCVFLTDEDVRSIIMEHDIECHPLYYDREGVFDVSKRLGCIGCPLQGDRRVSEYKLYPILLKQILRRLILFHRRLGRNEMDAVLNLVYNLFYSNHGFKKYEQTYFGLFPNDPWERLYNEFGLSKDNVLSKLPKPHNWTKK